MNEANWAIENAEKIGVVALLIIVVFGLVWVIRFLYQEHKESEQSRKECEQARLQDANERAEIKHVVGKLEGKVETMERLHNDHLTQLIGTLSGKLE